MKTSTTLLIAAGAVVATVGVASLASADSRWGRSDDGARHGMHHASMGKGGMDKGGMHHRFKHRSEGPMGGMMKFMVTRRVIEMADTDGDGELSEDEIATFRVEIFDRHDANGDGRLSLDEYDAMFREITRPVMVRSFQFLDPDGDAQVTREEMDRPVDRLVSHLEGKDKSDRYSRHRDRGYGPADERDGDN